MIRKAGLGPIRLPGRPAGLGLLQEVRGDALPVLLRR